MCAYNFEPEDRTVSHHVASGVLSSGAVQVVKIACQFGSVIILSRLLPPTAFGLMAMVSPIYAFILIFHDLGLSQATIQKTGLHHAEVNAFFWLNVSVGVVLASITIAVSPLVGWYYNDERVINLTIAMGMLIIIGSIGNQHGTILQRRMKFPTLAIIDMTGTVCGLATSIIAALLMKNYWALYLGMAVAIIIPVTGVWIASSWRPTGPKYVPGLRDMLKFGAGITSFNFTTFLAGNMDNILIGHTWGGQALGFYDRAYKLLLFPLQRIVSPLAGTMVPLLSRLKTDPVKYRNVIHNSIGQLLFAIWPGIIWAIALSESLIPFILGKNWMSTIPIFIPLGIASLIQVFNCVPMWLFVSQGRGGDYARWGVFNALTSVVAFLLGLPHGAWGVAVAYAVSEYIRTPFLWWYATSRGPVKAAEILYQTVPQAVSGISAALALYYFHMLVKGSDFLILIMGLILSYTTFAYTMSLFEAGRKTLGKTAVFADLLFSHFNQRTGRRV